MIPAYRTLAACLALAGVSLWSASVAANPTNEAAERALIAAAINSACRKHVLEGLDAFVAQHAIGTGELRRRIAAGWRRRFETALGRLTIERLAPHASLYRLTIQLDTPHAGKLRPTLWAVTRPDCTVKDARRLRYADSGAPLTLEHLDPRMESVRNRVPLNPAVPRTRAPVGVPVALIDTGVNYTLPEIAARLARGRNNHLIGYDFWDLDERPFDAHPIRSAFAMDRHGTSVASRLLRDAPVATLAAYRYPRPDMQRMPALVTDIAKHEIKIANISLVSRKRSDWLPFRDAAAAHPEILFVVAAGNRGRNLSRTAYYPASFALSNMLVVTAADARDKLADGVNWSATVVDLMVLGADLVATGYDGRARRFSGSSYAAARISALAACLLSANPTWSAARLKADIIERAARRPMPKLVRHGLIDADELLKTPPAPAAAARPGYPAPAVQPCVRAARQQRR